MNKNQETISYLKNITNLLIAFLFFVFPLFFLTGTTDLFTLPKQILIVGFALVLGLLTLLRMVFEKKITLKSTPLNLPLVLLAIFILLSSFFSPNFYDSLLQSFPLVFSVIIFFTVINNVEDKSIYTLILFSFIAGGVAASLISVLYNFNLFIFPFAETKFKFFNTFGSSLQGLIYLLPVLVIALYSFINYVKNKKFNYQTAVFGLSSLVLLSGIIVLFYQSFLSSQKVVILPFKYGFQMSFASISQDSQRLLSSFLSGSGYGTFSTVFTRFKPVSFNLEPNIWNLTFSFSSSYVLELLATGGILSLLAFIFLIFQMFRTRQAFTGGILYGASLFMFVLAFFLPFSFSGIFLLIILPTLYISYVYLYADKSHHIYNLTVSLVAFRQGLIVATPEQAGEVHKYKTDSWVLPAVLFSLWLVVSVFVGYFIPKFLIADFAMRQSLDVLSNSAQKAYDLERQAINDFQYKSDYYRLFSQLNIGLANSITSGLPKDSSPSAQAQQTILSLVQQSINSARVAVNLSPLSALGWENLSQIYRNLINVGQNADQFSIATLQKAISLDSANPQYYVELGGIYFALGQYDNAQIQFQTAINLKNDFAIAYYNLGHVFEAKGDLKQALTLYQVVKSLVSQDKENSAKIDAEISVAQKKLNNSQVAVPAGQTLINKPVSAQNQQPLKLSSPSAIPARAGQVNIPPPPGATESGK